LFKILTVLTSWRRSVSKMRVRAREYHIKINTQSKKLSFLFFTSFLQLRLLGFLTVFLQNKSCAIPGDS
jgi:hypothetical protein